MTPLPYPLGPAEVMLWRLDVAPFAPSWDSGEGAFRFGGRWNAKGVRAVYCAVDPATAILEVAVHKGFETLDAVPHVLTAARLSDPAAVHVLPPEAIPDSGWLRPGIPSAAQQAFGAALLARHGILAVPSTVSSRSWNVVFDPARAAGAYALRSQEGFVLDPRLNRQG